jgi:hypothetical protein
MSSKKSAMFDGLLLHAPTRKLLEQIASHPSQGYLFVGPAGSGKYTSALQLAKVWAGNKTELIIEVLPETQQSIGIKAVHNLRERLSRRIGLDERRSVLIGSEVQLTSEAQNALLKLLEEPPERTTFIITTDILSSLLPTVRSRLQIVRFPYLAQEAVVNLISSMSGLEPADSLRAYYMGGKTPGGAMLVAEQLEGIEQAKLFLTNRSYERLVAIMPLTSQREEFANFAGHIQTIYEALMWQAARTGDKTLAAKTAGKLETLSEILQAVEHNGNLRLLSTRFVLEL